MDLRIARSARLRSRACYPCLRQDNRPNGRDGLQYPAEEEPGHYRTVDQYLSQVLGHFVGWLDRYIVGSLREIAVPASVAFELRLEEGKINCGRRFGWWSVSACGRSRWFGHHGL